MKKKVIIFSILLSFTLFLTSCKSNEKPLVKEYPAIEQEVLDKSIETINRLKTDIDKLNRICDEYYVNFWQNEHFISYNTYLTSYDGKEVTINEIANFMNYSLPQEFYNVKVHFVKPSSLKPFLNEGILDEDLELMSVFTAIDLGETVFISSRFDKGGIISKEQYQDFLNINNTNYGEIVRLDFDAKKDAENTKTLNYSEMLKNKDVKNIIKSIKQKDSNLSNYNLKQIAFNEKYASVVISSGIDPAYIKQFVLQKNKKWEIILSELELKENYKLYINYAYPDFDLNLLPYQNYDLYSYYNKNITSDITQYVELLKQQNILAQAEDITYACKAAKTIYFELKTGEKLLGQINEESELVVYYVENYQEAIKLMDELKIENPPVFILRFE